MPDARTIIDGRIATDPRYNQVNGKDVANLRILAGRSKRLDDGSFETLSTTAYDVAFWGEHAHLVSALSPAKGDSVEVTGAITGLEAYDGQNGQSLSAKVNATGIKVFPKQDKGGFSQQSTGNFAGRQPVSAANTAWNYGDGAQQSSGWGQDPNQGQTDPWAQSNGQADEPPF